MAVYPCLKIDVYKRTKMISWLVDWIIAILLDPLCTERQASCLLDALLNASARSISDNIYYYQESFRGL